MLPDQDIISACTASAFCRWTPSRQHDGELFALHPAQRGRHDAGGRAARGGGHPLLWEEQAVEAGVHGELDVFYEEAVSPAGGEPPRWNCVCEALKSE